MIQQKVKYVTKYGSFCPDNKARQLSAAGTSSLTEHAACSKHKKAIEQVHNFF